MTFSLLSSRRKGAFFRPPPSILNQDERKGADVLAEKGKIRRWTRLLVPGLMFQSLLVGGGYGTGAEIARYFGRYGLWGGLLGMGAAAALWSLVCAVTFEFARVFRTWDYGSLMRALLGRWGVWYDLCCFAMTLLVLGVADATAGTMAALA